MPGWTWVRLGDVCTKIGSGATPRGGSAVYQDSGPYSLIRSQNVYNDGFRSDGLVHISHELATELSNVEVLADDILVNITGDSVARVCQVESGVLPARVNQHVAIVRPIRDKLDPRFLRYVLTSPQTQVELNSWASSGATRPALTKSMLEDLEVFVPTNLNEQRVIARVLGGLDDKIELNRRMNETLEAMARALFKLWFVDIPDTGAKGLVRLDEILTLHYGKGLRVADRRPGDVPIYGSGGTFDFHDKALVPGPTIVIGRKGTVGSLFWVDEPSYPGDTVFYVESRLPLTFCFYLLETLGLKDMNTDAAVPGLNRENVYRLEVSMPAESAVAEFDAIASKVRERIRIAREESRTLASLRDTLLPKLISGELRVSDAERLIQDRPDD